MDSLERLVASFRKSVERLTEMHLAGGIDTNVFLAEIRSRHMEFLQQALRIRIENRKRHSVLARVEQAEILTKRIAEEAMAANADMTGQRSRRIVVGAA
jgi:hypothetical protein